MSSGRTTSEAEEWTPADSRDDEPSSRTKLHPVTSGGFSASSISEEFVKDLLRVKECLESSLETMQKGDGAQQEKGTDEIVVDDQHKPAKDEANRELRFQIMQNPPNQTVNRSRRCHCKRSGGTRSKANHSHRGHRGHTCHGNTQGKKRHCRCNHDDRRSARPSRHRSCSSSCHSCSQKSFKDMDQTEKSEKESRTRKKTSDRARKVEDAPEVFRRYKSGYSSSDSKSSSSGSEDQAAPGDKDKKIESQEGADAVKKASKRSSKHSTKSKSVDGVARKVERKSQRHVKKFDRDDLEEATVEKHVLELNFPRSPGMTSISNLLQRTTDEEYEEEGKAKVVHQIRPGQVCELLTDGQVIRVCLPERNRMTVEHVIQPGGDVGENRIRQRRGNRGMMMMKKKVEVESSESEEEEEEWVSEEDQRHHDWPKSTRREKQRLSGHGTWKKSGITKNGRNREESANRGLPMVTSIIANVASSSDSDEARGEEDVPRKRQPSSKFRDHKETQLADDDDDMDDDEDVCLLSSLKSRRGRCRDKWTTSRGPGEVAFSLKESRRVSRRRDDVSGEDDDVDNDAVASRRGRKATGSGPRLRVSSTVSLTPDGNGRNGNSFRVVFTDSNLNTELRYILQDGHGTSRHQSNLIITKDNGRQESPRRKQRGAGRLKDHHSDCSVSTVRALEDPRRTPHSSDVISSSYYSSTHESSLVLNDKKGGCKGRDVVTIVSKDPRKKVCLHDDRRRRRLQKSKNVEGRG